MLNGLLPMDLDKGKRILTLKMKFFKGVKLKLCKACVVIFSTPRFKHRSSPMYLFHNLYDCFSIILSNLWSTITPMYFTSRNKRTRFCFPGLDEESIWFRPGLTKSSVLTINNLPVFLLKGLQLFTDLPIVSSISLLSYFTIKDKRLIYLKSFGLRDWALV